MPRFIEGSLVAGDARFAIVVSRFNEFITEQLLDGALQALKRHGADTEETPVVWCPGALELPVAARRLAQSGAYDAIIGLGAVIRGATTHYDYVCSGAASGLQRAALDTEVPVIFGVITTETIEQAIERAGTKAGNKGADAACAAIEMAHVMRQLPTA
ncbi:6,7-dimethyl-8-ribityllumazine synthase [Salisaeta longa]|uniref:6,7-dimethyl-8-ribityllumazine synthase n=1 Tax=Salisaeta longa TaxID=503170 RepID=UPI0003B3CB1D|nr:6,7-dimethyl-8-ribityllumazine synthase [Salisaeta longa]